MSRDLQKATPFLREFSNLLVAYMKTEHGIRVIVTSVDRDYKVQMALYAQGRQPLSEVNRMRSFAGLPLISEKENRPVTWTMASKHIVNFDDGFTNNDLSRAVDFGILDSAGKYQGDIKADVNYDNRSDYEQLGFVGEKIGGNKIKWGGRFRNSKGVLRPDMPHFEEA